jgi:hypothetical protein
MKKRSKRFDSWSCTPCTYDTLCIVSCARVPVRVPAAHLRWWHPMVAAHVHPWTDIVGRLIPSTNFHNRVLSGHLIPLPAIGVGKIVRNPWDECVDTEVVTAVLNGLGDDAVVDVASTLFADHQWIGKPTSLAGPSSRRGPQCRPSVRSTMGWRPPGPWQPQAEVSYRCEVISVRRTADRSPST